MAITHGVAQPASTRGTERPTPSSSAATPQRRPQVHIPGNQSRLRQLQTMAGPHAATLAAIDVSRPGDAEEQAARAAADAPAAAISRPGGNPRHPGFSIEQVLGRGVPLSPSLANELAPDRSAELAHVQLHVGEKASRTAAVLGARAFTLGHDIVFAHAAYAPDSASGRKLLAHELAHVAQHSSIPRIFRDDETEAEVDQRVLQGLTDIVAKNPTDDQTRLNPLVELFTTVPQSRIEHLYRRLDPGAGTDDFAQYLKDKFTKTRADGLAFLRNSFSGKFPGTSAAPTGDVGANTATAATALPTGIPFGSAMGGDGWFFNPKYWVVKYIMRKGDQSQVFTSEEGKPTPFKQMQAFAAADAAHTFENADIDIEVSFGKFGGAAALNDLWNVESVSQYAFECLNAAWLVQLRGQYLSYPAASRDVDFDRDNKSYVMKFNPSGKPSRSNAGDFEEITLPAPIKLSQETELAAVLQPGDEATIANPFVKNNPAFRKENVIYLGGLKFMGHPFGTFTLKEYAGKLANYAPDQSASDDDKAKWVLDNTSIQDISRPRKK